MKSTLINRLKRNKGQLEGLIRAIEDGADCEHILIQFQASQSALNSAFGIFLEENLESCLSQGDTQKIKKLLPLILKK